MLIIRSKLCLLQSLYLYHVPIKKAKEKKNRNNVDNNN